MFPDDHGTIGEGYFLNQPPFPGLFVRSTETATFLMMPRPNLATQLVSLPTLFIVTLAGILTYTFFVIKNQKDDAVVIDFAGRARTLIQKDLSEVLLISQGANPEHAATRTRLEETLEVLIRGGPLVLNQGTGETFRLPPAPTPHIRKSLETQKKVLAEYIEKADAFLGRLCRT